MMRKYYLNLGLYISLLILVSIAIGILIILQKVWVALNLFILLAFIIYKLLKIVTRAIHETNKFINAIEIGEFNISFETHKAKGLDPMLKTKMKNAIDILSERTKELKTEQFFYDILLSRVDTPIFLMDNNERITWINKVATEIFKVKNPRMLRDLDSTTPHLSNKLKQLQIKETQIIKILENNRKVSWAATASLITLRGKDLKIISLKNIQKPLEENESEAWEKLAYVLTHEIMNSLTPIISLSETFADPTIEHDPKIMGKAIQTIFRRSKGLVEFVSNYQKLTKIPPPLKSNIKAKELILNISHLLKADGIMFSYFITPEDIDIYADRGQLEQVLINLIKNAWEATSTDSVAKVNLLIQKNNLQQTTISISDNGKGIPANIMDTIFLPFYTTKLTGSGIELSLCKQIVNNHGGSISVESEEKKETQFTIVL